VGKIGLDANIFLCILLPESTIAGNENIRGCERILKSLGMGNTGITSTILFAEIAWAFLREEKAGVELEAARKVIEGMQGLKLVPVDSGIAFEAGKLRRKYYSKKFQISYQDAIYLTTCLRENVETFYTTDSHLLSLKEKIEIREPKDFE
jgi:predicted nucleic acid-binding protein